MNFRSLRTVQTDISQIPMTSSSHDCGSLSRVVMVRKTDQRMINHKKPEAVSTVCLFHFLLLFLISIFMRILGRTQSVSLSHWKPFKRTKGTSRIEPLFTPKNTIWSNRKLRNPQALNVFWRELQTPSTQEKKTQAKGLSKMAAKHWHHDRTCDGRLCWRQSAVPALQRTRTSRRLVWRRTMNSEPGTVFPRWNWVVNCAVSLTNGRRYVGVVVCSSAGCSILQ